MASIEDLKKDLKEASETARQVELRQQEIRMLEHELKKQHVMEAQRRWQEHAAMNMQNIKINPFEYTRQGKWGGYEMEMDEHKPWPKNNQKQQSIQSAIDEEVSRIKNL